MLLARVSKDMARETEPLVEVSRLFDHSMNGKLRGGDVLAGTEFSEGTRQAFAQEQPVQASGLLGYVGAVSQPTGTETEPNSLRRGQLSEQEKVMPLPLAGPADVTPAYGIAGRAVVVVGAGESPVQGEGPQERSLDGELGDDMPMEECRIPLTVPELQQRLAQKATMETDHRFGNLYRLLTWEPLLDAAADRLLGDKGSRTPGLDGIDRDVLRRNRGHHMALLREQLKHRSFQPTPVKRVYIPKQNGKLRPLGIPTLYDRWVQMAIKMVIEPIFESDFQTFSHGFRPRRSCHTAMADIYARTIQPRKKVYWVIEGDIEGFFDHVHHKKLMSLLRQRIQDQHLLDLIWAFLRAGVMEGRLFKKTVEGTPQGGVLSPLLANIYLNHFDNWLTQRCNLGTSTGASRRERVRKAGGANCQMVRYADDFVIFSNGTKADTEAFQAEVKDWLAQELKLTLSMEKTKLTHYTDGFDFLGFTVKKTPSRTTGKEIVTAYPSTTSVQRAIRHIEDLTDRSQLLKSPADIIDALNAFLRGWGNYFRRSAGKRALRYVGNYSFRRLWRWLVQKHFEQHGWRKVKTLYYRDGTWTTGGRALLTLQAMPIEYPRNKAIPNPYLLEAPVPEPWHADPFRSTKWNGNQEYGANWTEARAQALATTSGTCAICGTDGGVEVNHITPRRKHGGNSPENLLPLCRTHHREAERRNSAVSQQQREILATLRSGEPGALKGARPVREGAL
ncbi:MAG: group II intron reverse transcriptase/maturase [Dehalococcoidia bacterium]